MGKPGVTAFGIPKPFTGHIGIIQTNAIASWRALGYQVILLGDCPGTGDAARRLSARHLPHVACNAWGTPMLDSAFALADEHANTDIVVYVNSDIILLDDASPALSKVARDGKGFLGVGRRCNMEISVPLDVALPACRRRLREQAAREGRFGHLAAIDFLFINRGGALMKLPPFAVGRPCWDDWMVAEALRLGIPVVDLTPRLLAIHQNHGYGHIPQGTGQRWEGPEAQANRAIAGFHMGRLTQANLAALPGGRLVPAKCYHRSSKWFDKSYRLRARRPWYAVRCLARSWWMCPQGRHMRALMGWARSLVSCGKRTPLPGAGVPPVPSLAESGGAHARPPVGGTGGT
jgi:hypothetical protein